MPGIFQHISLFRAISFQNHKIYRFFLKHTRDSIYKHIIIIEMQTENVNSHMHTCLLFLSRHIGIFCLKNEYIFIFLPIKLFFVSAIPRGEILPPFYKLSLANLS